MEEISRTVVNSADGSPRTNYSLTNELDFNQLSVIANIDIVTGCLSIIGASSIIISILVKRKFHIPEVQPLFQLSLADLFASILLVTDCVLFHLNKEDEIRELCFTTASISVAMYVTTFLLTVSYAAETLFRLRSRFDTMNRNSIHSHYSHKIMAAFSWIVPSLLVIPYIVVYQVMKNKPLKRLRNFECSMCLPLFHYRDDYCMDKWTRSTIYPIVSKYAFLAALVVVILLNFAIYLMVVMLHQKIQRNRGLLSSLQHNENRKLRNRVLLYQIVFIACWLPSAVLGFWSTSAGFEMSYSYPLYIIQAITTPLQGFLNAVIYGWFRRGFMSVLKDGDESTPLFPSINLRKNSNYGSQPKLEESYNSRDKIFL